MTLKTILLLFHVLGVIWGVGGVLMLDIDLLRLLRGAKVSGQTVAFTHFVSNFVKAGLIVVWVSGLAIIALAPDGPASVLANPKLQAKLVIVVALTVNATFIETLALPLLVRNVGRPLFDGVDQVRRSVVLCCGAISTLSWTYPVALGLARELNGVVPAQPILAVYAGLLVCLVSAMQVAGRMLYRPESDVVAPRSATPLAMDLAQAPLFGPGGTSRQRSAESADLTPDERARAARQAGREAVRASVAPDHVARDVAAFGSDEEAQQYRTGLFEGLCGRVGSGPDADGLLELVATDEVLRRKFAAVAPGEAARGAFLSEVERARRRTEDRTWAKVKDWHDSMVALNADATGPGQVTGDGLGGRRPSGVRSSEPMSATTVGSDADEPKASQQR